MTKLIIAEKPSVAMSIAKVLGAHTRSDGCVEGNGYIVSWCVGHLIGLAEPNSYGAQYDCKPWEQDLTRLPIIPETFRFAINKDTKRQFDVLKKLMNASEVGEIICATDAAREGECIFRYVYNAANCRKPFKRLWISSLEESAIKNGFANLRNGADFDNLYASGLCRAKSDWLVGMNATRLFSSVYKTFLSVGRVQTPTLAMIVERDYKVKNFVKEKFYGVNLDCGDFIACSERLNELSLAEKIKDDCLNKTAEAKEVKRVKKTENPPKLYDLTTLQREANKTFGYTAQETLDFTQKLYEKKFATYPRVDSQYITEDMAGSTTRLIEDLRDKYNVNLTANVSRVVNNAKVSDHHAILPTAEAVKQLPELSNGEKDILNLLILKLFCAGAEPHVYEAVTANIACGGHNFTAKGRSVIMVGWKGVETTAKQTFGISAVKDDGVAINNDEEEKVLIVSEGQVFNNPACAITESWTSPPKHYTEDTLLSAMETAGNADYEPNSDVEKKGIGTPATRANVIETLVKRGYIERKKKNILAAEKGINLIAIVPASIKSAKLTAEWETALQKIEKGETSANAFMNEMEAFIKKITADNSATSSQITFSNANNKETVAVGKCPKCGKDVVETPKAYSCGGGKGDCNFVIWKTVASKTIPSAQVKKLLEKGKTDKIKGFKGKTGKTFEAVLVLKSDFSAGFEF